MRRYVFVIIFISFVTVAVFGFAGMSGGYGHRSCIAATAQGVARCFDGSEGSTSAFFHVNVYKMFSLAIIGSAIAVMAVLFLWNIGRITKMSNIAQGMWHGRSGHGRAASWYVEQYARPRAMVLNWLALHNLKADGAWLQGA